MKRTDVLDVPQEVRDLVTACEVSGQQMIFERNGRAVAILTSYDEYLALHETIQIANDAELRAKIETADAQANRGEVDLVEEILG